MTDRTDLSLGQEHRLSRRRMIKTSLGAVAGIVAVSKVASASFPDGLNGAAGPLQNSDLEAAVRIPPPTTTTTLAPTPTGQIMFPIDARPGDCWISDNFGDCRGTNCSRRHEGLDISGNRGADLFAVVTGELTWKYDDRGLTYGAGNGWTLYDETTDITYKYFHMGTHADGLQAGDVVQQGQVIGTVGNSGTSGANSDSNYHLHFEYRPKNVAQDPRPLLVRNPNCTWYD
jgi:murein DD-endopeptidase MepM/ murein hydrolase activator NlpD